MRIICLLLVVIFLGSCDNKKKEPLGKFKSNYYRIPIEDVVDLARQGKLDYTYAKFMNVDGTALSAKDTDLLNKGLMGKDYFSDNTGKIMEVRVRPIEGADKMIEVQRRELASKPLARYRKVDIACDTLARVFAEMKRTDHEVRFTKQGNLKEVDFKNQELLVAITEKCGMQETYINTIWQVIQHSPTGVMAYYYADLEKLVIQRKLSPSKLALLEDRLLMKHGYKQRYGTQVVDGQLYDLENPEKINLMRQEMGMQRIEKYLKHHGLEWEVEKKRMMAITSETNGEQ